MIITKHPTLFSTKKIKKLFVYVMLLSLVSISLLSTPVFAATKCKIDGRTLPSNWCDGAKHNSNFDCSTKSNTTTCNSNNDNLVSGAAGSVDGGIVADAGNTVTTKPDGGVVADAGSSTTPAGPTSAAGSTTQSATTPEVIADTSCKPGDTRDECNPDKLKENFEKALGSNDQTATCGSSGDVKISVDVNCASRFSNPIIAYLVGIIQFLTYGVGIVVILMIIVGGIQYASAGGNAQAVQAARNRVTNALIALLLYIFAFAILNYLVPGGLLT